MDRQKCSLRFTDLIRVPIFLLWVISSTIVYSIICILMCLVASSVSRYIGRLWTIHLLRMGGVKVVVDGLEKLDPSKRYVFISNHQSALDIPVIIAGLNHYVSFIAKKELFIIPFFVWGISALVHIRIDRSNPRKARSSLDKAVMRLKKLNTSLILFPEGTRSTDGQLGEFKQGSFALALMAGVQVVPLTIKDAMLRLPKKSWRINPGTIYLQIGDPIDVTPQTTKAEICQKTYDAIKKSLT